MKFSITLLLLVYPCFTFSQTDSSYTLTGTIVDAALNTPLQGAHIIKNKHNGVKTDINGFFSIKVKENDNIKISFIGYKSINYTCKHQQKGKYLTKFKLSKDSVFLDEVIIFPYPTYKEFKKAFLALDKQKEQIKIKGINTYIDKQKSTKKPTVLNPASYIYDRLFDKQAKLKRRLNRHRNTIKRAKKNQSSPSL